MKKVYKNFHVVLALLILLVGVGEEFKAPGKEGDGNENIDTVEDEFAVCNQK